MLCSNKRIEKIGKVSSASVEKGSGRGWSEWIEILEKAGARNWNHREIVAYLKNRYKLTPWWQQGVAAGYELHIGKRGEGRNLKGEYGSTSSRTVPISQKNLWKLLVSPEGLAVWLKPLGEMKVRQGATFETEDGFFGEVRTMKSPERMRLRWQEPEWEKASIVQVFIVKRPGDKCILVFNHEKLVNGRLRLQMKAHWNSTIENVKALIKES